MVPRALLAEVRRVRDGYVSADYAPAGTLVFVSGLVRKGWMIGIEAVASFSEAIR